MDCSTLPVEIGNWSRVYLDGARPVTGFFRHVPTNVYVCPDDFRCCPEKYAKEVTQKVLDQFGETDALDLAAFCQQANDLRHAVADALWMEKFDKFCKDGGITSEKVDALFAG